MTSSERQAWLVKRRVADGQPPAKKRKKKAKEADEDEAAGPKSYTIYPKGGHHLFLVDDPDGTECPCCGKKWYILTHIPQY
jgi:hypothetical protein